MALDVPDPVPPCYEVNGEVPSWLELRYSDAWGIRHWFCTLCSMWADHGHINSIKHKQKLKYLSSDDPPVRDSSGPVPDWLVLRMWPEGSCESWYCTLCDAFADQLHLASRRHTGRFTRSRFALQQFDASSAEGAKPHLSLSDLVAPSWSASICLPASRPLPVAEQPVLSSEGQLVPASGQVVFPASPNGSVRRIPPPPPPVLASSQQGVPKKSVVPPPPPPPIAASSFSVMATRARMLPPPPPPPLAHSTIQDS